MIMGLITRWLVFIGERFEPASHTFMIASFASANLAMAYAADPFNVGEGATRLVLGFALVWLVFFHMRLFDDIKDYQTDRMVNRDRPLPRGVLTTDEFGAGILFCVLLEIFVAASLGFNIFTTYVMVLAFTLVMRQEFFIGDWMRPKMELYAATHTFSASLLGLLIYSASTGKTIVEAPRAYLMVVLGNWFVFNVFEFGRKTFGREEEREGVDSYSLRLMPFGAFALLGANIFLAFFMLYSACAGIDLAKNFPSLAAQGAFSNMLISAAVVSFLVVAAGMVYSLKPSKFNAKFYRGVVSLYLVAYHLAISVNAYVIFK